MIKIAVCDDEPFMAREISDRLSKYMAEKRITSYRVSSFSDGQTLLESNRNLDLIFLDIQMERPGGMETAKMLRRRGYRGLLIFNRLFLTS